MGKNILRGCANVKESPSKKESEKLPSKESNKTTAMLKEDIIKL